MQTFFPILEELKKIIYSLCLHMFIYANIYSLPSFSAVVQNQVDRVETCRHTSNETMTQLYASIDGGN